MNSAPLIQLTPVDGTDGAVVAIGLNNPPLNLVTLELLAQLHQAITDLANLARTRDSRLRAVILHQSDSRAFCGGSDMREFGGVAATPARSKVLFESHVLSSLARLPVPVIAAIEGPALGGGLELALACDLRVAGAGVTLALTEASIGGIAGTGSQRLTKLVGPARAKDLLFTSRRLTAAEGLAWGIVDRVVHDGSAYQSAVTLAGDIAKNAALSVTLAKHLVDVATDRSLDEGLAAAVTAQESVFASHDLQEGAAAFRERRSPKFVGR